MPETTKEVIKEIELDVKEKELLKEGLNIVRSLKRSEVKDIELDEEEKELLKEGLNLVRSFKTVGKILKYVIYAFIAFIILFSSFVDAIKNIIAKLWP